MSYMVASGPYAQHPDGPFAYFGVPRYGWRRPRWTVQPIWAGQGYGAVAPPAPACGPNETRNPADQGCYCNVGYSRNDAGVCSAIDVSAPCQVGGMRSPIDKKCTCPPGTEFDPRPEGTTCVRMRWFPNCKDAAGNKVPNCAFGYPLREGAIAVGGGVVLGLVLGALFT